MGAATQAIGRAATFLAFVFTFASVGAIAEEASVQTVFDKLENPHGVAVRPANTGDRIEIFVVQTDAHSIVKFTGDETKPTDVITSFPTEAPPIALWFLDRDNLVVTTAGVSTIRRFELTKNAEPQSADTAKQQIKLDGGEQEQNLVVNARAIARTRANDKVPDLLLVLGPASDATIHAMKIPVRAGTLDEAANFVADDDQAPEAAASAIAVSEQGYIVIAQQFPPGGKSASQLLYINPIGWKPVLRVPLSLQHVIGLAYSPKGNLYAIARSTSAGESGVYRIDDASGRGTRNAAAVKIAPIEGPTGLAFSPDGKLFITATDPGNKSVGKLLRVNVD